MYACAENVWTAHRIWDGLLSRWDVVVLWCPSLLCCAVAQHQLDLCVQATDHSREVGRLHLLAVIQQVSC
jgi:hypothetical protein